MQNHSTPFLRLAAFGLGATGAQKISDLVRRNAPAFNVAVPPNAHKMVDSDIATFGFRQLC
jgi:hypothetical protein